MADEAGGEGQGSGEGAGAGADDAAKAAAAAAAAKGGEGKGAKGSEGAGDYDWRAAVAGEDTAFRKRLDRFTDPQAFGKSFLEADKTINDATRLRIPGEGSTPEEIAAYAKARGIPETPDKYDIKVKPPEGMKLSDADADRLKGITANLHKMGGIAADPTVVNLAHQMFYAEREEFDAQMEANAEIAHEKTQSMLKKLWPGQEMTRNVGLANAAIREFFGAEFDEIRQLQFADGTRLGDNLLFNKAMAAIGRETQEDPLFLEAGRNGGDASKGLLDQKTAILRLQSTNPKAYAEAAKEGGKLDQINAALQRHEERAGQSMN